MHCSLYKGIGTSCNLQFAFFLHSQQRSRFDILLILSQYYYLFLLPIWMGTRLGTYVMVMIMSNMYGTHTNNIYLYRIRITVYLYDWLRSSQNSFIICIRLKRNSNLLCISKESRINILFWFLVIISLRIIKRHSYRTDLRVSQEGHQMTSLPKLHLHRKTWVQFYWLVNNVLPVPFVNRCK